MTCLIVIVALTALEAQVEPDMKSSSNSAIVMPPLPEDEVPILPWYGNLDFDEVDKVCSTMAASLQKKLEDTRKVGKKVVTLPLHRLELFVYVFDLVRQKAALPPFKDTTTGEKPRIPVDTALGM